VHGNVVNPSVGAFPPVQIVIQQVTGVGQTYVDKVSKEDLAVLVIFPNFEVSFFA